MWEVNVDFVHTLGEKYIQHIYESKVLSVVWVEEDQCLLTTGPNGIMVRG